MRLLLPVAAILLHATAFGDGGSVVLRKEAGDLVVTVFASPNPLRVGQADLSVLLQNRDGLDPVLDADVSMLLRASNIEFVARPTREQAANKLLYAAPVIFARPGKWEFAVGVVRNGKETNLGGTLEVVPARDRAFSYAGYIAFPPVMIVFFVIRERLVRRRSERK